jgi:hypothetical protein
MNVKLVLLGGLAFWLATWVVSMFTGPLIHTGVLAADYQAYANFWRPELMEVPPDMVGLLPRWIATGLFLSFILAALYGWVRPVIDGHGWVRGVKFGAGVFLLVAGVMASWTGIFNLPDKVWIWWALEALIVYILGGAALGWVADRWAPSSQVTR